MSQAAILSPDATSAATVATRAETILTGGRIWCGLDDGFVEALAIAGGRVLATGTAAEIAALGDAGTKVLDLGGRLAIPGLNDAHMHFILYGLAMAEVDLRPSVVPDLPTFLARIAERVRETPPGQWVIGRGYDHFRLTEARHPHISELDAIAPDHPVYVVRNCGHVAVANTKALELAGIGPDTASPFGGLIERDANGITGLLAETGREPVIAVLPELTQDDLRAAIARAGADLLSYGITSVMDAAVGIRSGWTEMEAYQDVHRRGAMPLRVYACLMGDKTRSIVDEAHAAGLVTGAGDELFRIGPVKIFTDGSASARTAAMTESYENDSGTGIMCLTDAECHGLIMDTHARGYQMAIHAIGDAAIEQVLDGYEAALAAHPHPDRRHRIEHCGWLRPDQLDRMKAMGILPAPQPSFVYWFGDLYVEALGQERSDFCYPMRSFIEAGLHPSASTDCPVTEIDPFATIAGMVTRRSRSGATLGLDQRLSMAEALHAYTSDAAYAAGEEGIKGRLVPGQLADIAVLSQDLFEIPEERIVETRCEMTILGGQVAFARAG